MDDAILAAERADAVERFVKFGFKGQSMSKKNDDIVPMDIDTLRSRVHNGSRGSSSSGQRGRVPMRGGGGTSQRKATRHDECYFYGKRATLLVTPSRNNAVSNSRGV